MSKSKFVRCMAAVVLVGLIEFLLGVCQAYAEGPNRTIHDVTGWEYRWGDRTTATQELPDTSWLEDSESWNSLVLTDRALKRGDHSDLWLRVRLPDGEWRDSGMMVQLFQQYAVFIDHRLIYSFGNPDPHDPGIYQGAPKRMIPLPTGALGKVLYIHAYSESEDIGFIREPVIAPQAYFLKQILKEDLLKLVFGSFYILIGLFSLLIYLKFRNQNPYLYFSIFSCFFGVYSICRTSLIFLFLDVPLLWIYIELFSLFLGVIGIVALLWAMFGDGHYSIIRRLVQAHILFIVCFVALHLTRLITVPEALRIYQYFLLVSMVIALGQILSKAWKGNWEARVILAGTFTFCGAGAIDIFSSMQLIFIDIPSLSYMGVLVFIFSILIVMMQRFTEMMFVVRNSEKLSLVGQMAAGVAHEIRNPMTVISGFLQLIKKEPARIEYLDLVLDEVQRVNGIVSEFLLLSKPTGRNFEPNEVERIIHDAAALFEAEMKEKQITIVQSYEEPLPPIVCEHNQIKQVLINILKNAIESMEHGGEIRAEAVSKGKDDVLIRIIDQGVGIKDGDSKKIGEPFFTTKANGMGIGLLICKKIIESHGGSMKLVGKVNQGTTVEIILPVNPLRGRNKAVGNG